MKDLKAMTALLAILVLFVVGVVLYALSSVLLPFVVAVLLSFIFKPIVLALVKRRVPVAVALIVVIVIVAGALTLVSMLVYSSVGSFVANAPKYQERLSSLATGATALIQSVAERVGGDASKFNPASVIQLSTIAAFASASVGTFISFASNGFLVVLFMLFLLGSTGEMSQKVVVAFSHDRAETIATIIRNIDRRVRKYLIMKTLVNLGMAIFTTLLLMLLGVDFAVLWGLLTFFLNYIPNFGSVIAAILPTVTALVQFDSLTRPLLTLILLIVGHNIIGNVIEPKLMQFSLNLSPVLILLSLIFWGWLWGVVGMVLAVPITSTLKIICENIDVLNPIAVMMSGKIDAIAGKRPDVGMAGVG